MEPIGADRREIRHHGPHAAALRDGARRRRDDAAAPHRGLCDARQRRQAITPTLIDRIQDRNGTTIFRADQRPCDGCNDVDWQNQPVPMIPDNARADRRSGLGLPDRRRCCEGVVQRGTGTAVKAVGKPIAGKTGTTNDWQDAWFVGFTPDLAAGVYVGYDDPANLGSNETGGHLAAPIFRDFMMAALKDAPANGVPHAAGLAACTGSARRPDCRPAPASRRSGRATSPGTEPGQRTAIRGSAARCPATT